MLKRKDLLANIIPQQTSYRWQPSENSNALISKRIKTQPDENRNFITNKLNEIKQKYSSRREAPLSQISCQALRNMNHLKIREVDSPISCLQKSREHGYYSNKQIGLQPRRFVAQNVHLRREEVDPRVNNIDKINEKIKNILKSIEHKKQECEKYYESIPSRRNSAKGPQQFHSLEKSKIAENPELKVPILDVYRRNLSSQRDRHQYFSHKVNKYQQIRQQTVFNSQKGRPQSQWSNNMRPATPSITSKEIYKISHLQPHETISRQSIANNETFEESIVMNKPMNTEPAQTYQPTRRNRVKTEATQVKNKPTRNKQQMQKLFEMLKKQVQLDEQYRNKKYAFKQIKQPNKIEKLMMELTRMGVKIQSLQQLQAEMKVSEQQYNPFYTCREDTDYNSIAQSFKFAHHHWINSVQRKFSFRNLTQQGFSQNCVDMDHKGYIIVEDLVRMLNLQADTFVRNRDLVLIYRRLGPQKVHFRSLMETLCFDF